MQMTGVITQAAFLHASRRWAVMCSTLHKAATPKKKSLSYPETQAKQPGEKKEEWIIQLGVSIAQEEQDQPIN